MKKMQKQMNNGITLIALVITIIVLLILAGVTIATLTGENGILTKATEASEKTNQTNVEEQVYLAVVAGIETDGKINLDNLNNELSKIEGLTYNGSPILDNNKIESLPSTVTVDGYDITINGDGSIGNNPSGGDTGQTTVNVARIPEGFYHVEGTTVTGGLVISDVEGDDLNNSAGGNQYVWIPVDGIFGEDGTIDDVRGTKGEKRILLGRYSFDSSGIPSEYLGSYKEETQAEHTYGNTTTKDIEGFIDSVRKNGGYYIARFEASKGSNNKAESKYDKAVWSRITQPSAASVCRDLYEGINSDLVNSYAWDTAILFIQKYSGDEDYSRQVRIQNSLANTGKTTDGTNFDVRCNIYDMAGNCAEWTTETSSDPSIPCVFRGVNNLYSNNYTSTRYGAGASSSYIDGSFRPLLYL